MELREHMEYLVKIGDDVCESKYVCTRCPFSVIIGDGNCSNHPYRTELACQWLADHPETPEPVKPVRVSKTAQRESGLYSLDFSDGRLTLYRWHGKDYESVSWGGTVADFNQFEECFPEGWLSLSANMIARSAK